MGCPKLEYFHEPVLRCVWNANDRKDNCATMEESRAVEEIIYLTGNHSIKLNSPPSEGLGEASRSGINFVLYNNVFEVVEENTGYLPVDDKINSIQVLATDLMVMKEAGFFEIFVDNQAQTPVYYDNLMVTTRGGVNDVIEVNAYYPFGMLMPGLGLIAPKDKYNGYKHSAKELQREMELQWYDHGARMLGTTVSRWWTPDPLAESFYAWSPYCYAFNNPIRFAKKIGANFLDVAYETWSSRKNVEFLQGVVKRGDDVIFAGKYNPKLLDPTSILAQEIRYLQRHGYSWNADYTRLIKK